MKDREQGAWFEGKVTRVVYDPDKLSTLEAELSDNTKTSDKTSFDKESDSENNPPSDKSSEGSPSKSKKKGIAKYFGKSSNVKKKQEKIEKDANVDVALNLTPDTDLLYKVHLDAE